MSATIHRITITSTVRTVHGIEETIWHRSCYCGALKDTDGYLYSFEDAQKQTNEHIMSIPASRIRTHLGEDGFWVMEEHTEEAEPTTEEQHAGIAASEAEYAAKDLISAPISYTDAIRDELQEALNAVAASKSPTARERNVMTAHLLNARTARRLLSEILINNSEFARMDAESVDANYLMWERTITDVANLNRRALRK